MSVYGYCGKCGAPVISRTRGIPSYDTCEKGHRGVADLTVSKATFDRITALEAQIATAEHIAQAYDDAGDRAIATGIRIALAAYRAAKGEA